MSRVRDVVVNTTGTAVTVTTTTEKDVIASGPVPMHVRNQKVLILGWLQITTGTGTTGVTVAIRRGTGIAGDLVGEIHVEPVTAAAGSIQQHSIMVSEDRQLEGFIEYSLTVDQAGASADGTVQQATIVVIML